MDRRLLLSATVAKGTRPAISFVIPVRNGARTLQRCLKSIQAAVAGIDAELIVADNGSTDASTDIARAAGVAVLHVPDVNVATVRNLAARAAIGDLLAFVDADHELVPGWATVAIATLRDPGIAAAGAMYTAPDDATWVQLMYDRLRRRHPRTEAVEWIGSGNLVVRRSAFDAVGGFDTSLETCEDVDLCQRLRARGARILAVDALKSVHHGDPSTLAALFLGEMWRGRDNLRVSFRGPLTARSLPSVAIPVIQLAALIAITAGLLTLPLGGGSVAAAGGIIVLGLTLVRTGSLLSTGSACRPTDFPRALIFALVYHTARALALVRSLDHAARLRF